MDPTYTDTVEIQRVGQHHSAQVTIRFLPNRGPVGVGFTSEAERYRNAMCAADPAKKGHEIWNSVAEAIHAGKRRLGIPTGYPEKSFRAQVVRFRVSELANSEDTAHLLKAASRKATEAYFADLEGGRIHLNDSDFEKPFEYLPSPGFDDEFISRRQCFLEYVAENRPGFLFGFAVSRSLPVEDARAKRTLTPTGISDLKQAVSGYLCGCRPEADALVAKSFEALTLADAINEPCIGHYGGSWGHGWRDMSLAYAHWLRAGERDEEAIARARTHFLTHFRSDKHFDRRSANLAAPELMFLGADDVLIAMSERLASRRGKKPARPGGLFGDALRIATAADEDERDRLKTKLRKRMPLQFFRWMHHGHYLDVAFVLQAIFPRPEGPPSRLIERVWDVMPDLERHPNAYFGWDIARKRTSANRKDGRVIPPD